MKFFSKKMWSELALLSMPYFFTSISWAATPSVETNAIDYFFEAAEKSEALPPEGASDHAAY